MPLPTIEELADALQGHVDAKDDQDEFIEECVRDAVAFITGRVPNTTGGVDVVDGYVVPVATASPLGDDLYRREVIELGAELFWRRQAKNGVVGTDSLGNAIRVSNDPYKASAGRLATLRPLGFA